MPALAPSRQRSPMLTRAVPPPERVPMIEAPPPTSEPSPTTTPCAIRPSTMDVPSVPALKLQKPSCITVVPLARWAPSRTRSASAIRTPGRHDVVGHPGELVDPEHLHRARLAQPQPGALEPLDGAGAEVGPHDVGEHAEDAVEVDRVGRDQTVREQVQAQVGVGGVGRCGVQVDHHVHHVLAHPAARVLLGRRGQVGRGAVRAAPARPPPGRGSGTRCPGPCRPR